MLIQKCKKCSKQFDWKTIIRATWLGSYSPIKCSQCKSVHHPKFYTRLVIGFGIIIPFILNLFGGVVTNLTGNKFSFTTIIFLCILWGTLLVGLTPFYARYHIKEKIVT